MAEKYILKTADGDYYSLAESHTARTKDKTKATLFDTLEEAHYWNDVHAIHFVKLKDLGFEVFKRNV